MKSSNGQYFQDEKRGILQWILTVVSVSINTIVLDVPFDIKIYNFLFYGYCF